VGKRRLQTRIEGRFKCVAPDLEALRGELLVDLRRHLVQTQLDDRHVRQGGFQVIAQAALRERELRLAQLVERATRVDQQEVAFVSEQLDEDAIAVGLPLGAAVPIP
jgi:hypothetical protein